MDDAVSLEVGIRAGFQAGDEDATKELLEEAEVLFEEARTNSKSSRKRRIMLTRD